MESKLNNCLDELLKNDGIRGVAVADRHGLCLGVKGEANEESCGIWTALLQEAGKLEPTLPPPTLVLENSYKQCVVQGNDRLVVSIYKDRV